jgi:hypothetical protein
VLIKSNKRFVHSFKINEHFFMFFAVMRHLRVMYVDQHQKNADQLSELELEEDSLTKTILFFLVRF